MKKINIAVDLGTTNSVVAHWSEELDSPEIIHLNNICRNGKVKKEIDDSYTIPSTLYLRKPKEVYRFPFNYLFSRLKSKTRARIGMDAVNFDGGMLNKSFVDRFKSYLGKNSFKIIGRLGKWRYNAEEAARIFLKELFADIKREKGVKVGNVTFCVPVDFYEFYRARLKRIASGLNIKKVKTIDEPVAAALGYGLNLEGGKNILVIDFGAGTFDVALIQTQEKTHKKGECKVIAKDGAPIGGNLIDAWIVEALCKHYSYSFDRLSADERINWWYRILLNEACRIKEDLFFKETETFMLLPAYMMKEYIVPVKGDINALRKPKDVTRTELIAILKKNKLYSILNATVDSVMQSAQLKGVTEDMLDEVLMVGGSTLLPNVYSVFEKRFGRNRVRAWQPFNAVAFGAAAFGEQKFSKTDHITHDYALLTYDKKTLEQEYTVIVPRGTEYPTSKHFWKRQFVPTCALGEPESIFKLVVCEIGQRHTFDQEFVWDEKGQLHSLKEGSDKLVIPLNEADPTMGYLRPAHYPSDKRPRVEISFMINEDKWLCTTALDLRTNKYLLEGKPVIRLA